MIHPVLKRFPGAARRPVVTQAQGCYVHLEDGRKLLDATSGWCAQHILGYSHPVVLDAMREQMLKYCHIDVNCFENPTLTELAHLLLSQAPGGLDKVYFCGTGGSESVEAAMKLSYQFHFEKGKPSKRVYISRQESFHGSTLQSIALSDIDIYSLYGAILPQTYAKIPVHYPLRGMRPGESLEEYALRGASDLERKILEIGPENVCAFVGETMLGSLLGDVPPAPGYWKAIRKVCDRYGVHLILDEVYCGMGRSGKIYCCEWDSIAPDFLCAAKALGGGYAPLSAVVTRHEIEDVIRAGHGRIMSGHTYQGYALGASVALAIQKIVHQPETLSHINRIGQQMRNYLINELSSHRFFKEVHGRGSIFALEYETPDNTLFAARLQSLLEEEYQVLASCKWHRISFAIPFIFTHEEAHRVCKAVNEAFQRCSEMDGMTS